MSLGPESVHVYKYDECIGCMYYLKQIDEFPCNRCMRNQEILNDYYTQNKMSNVDRKDGNEAFG